MREIRAFGGSPEQNLYITGDAAVKLDELASARAGTVSLIYMDPPFYTGKKFEVRVKVGAQEWKSGKGSLILPAYDDKRELNEYLAYLRGVLETSKTLLTDDGLIFVHIDFRLHAHMKLLLDEVMGEKNFINELIWTYESGGRARNFFSRKHDIILLYSKTENYDLHTQDVAIIRASKNKQNHMRREVDEDGRTYRTIMSAGREYRYYDDEPVPPSDVWDDISHLQQKDPQRTGYDTQKPLALLERIVKCASREGDTVLDPFCGSGTALEAAAKNGRHFIGIDSNPMCALYARRRTDGSDAVFEVSESAGSPVISAKAENVLAGISVRLENYEFEEGVCDVHGLDAVDSWGAGTFEDGVFTETAREYRSAKNPELTFELTLTSVNMIRVSDITGRDFYVQL